MLEIVGILIYSFAIIIPYILNALKACAFPEETPINSSHVSSDRHGGLQDSLSEETLNSKLIIKVRWPELCLKKCTIFSMNYV